MKVTTSIHAPEFAAGLTWVQGGPLVMAQLRGRPVLIDFWDYTCVNCLRTVPYLKAWHERYAPHGLVVVGVHAPEFTFAREESNVARAVRELGIEYPVVLDNGYALWSAYDNHYWPAKYLVDKDGYIRSYHFGEGAYGETESQIQDLLREISPDIQLPTIMEPVRGDDAPGAVCYRGTPELYLGYQRGRFGNVDLSVDRPAHYQDLSDSKEGLAYLGGHWLLGSESLTRPAGAKDESKLTLRYSAKEVNLVIHPPSGQGRVEVLQDSQPLSSEDAGADVRFEDGRSVVLVDSPRMYALVNNRAFGEHDLSLTTCSDGIGFYAFTFVSCVAEAAA